MIQYDVYHAANQTAWVNYSWVWYFYSQFAQDLPRVTVSYTCYDYTLSLDTDDDFYGHAHTSGLIIIEVSPL